jgi:tripartite-type tricarboxylate transporter receptor subunit TctC
MSIWPSLPVARDSIKDFEYLGWAGLALPSGTPQEIVSALHESLMRVLTAAVAEQWFAERGAGVGAEPAQEFAEFVRAEHRRWGEFIREAGLSVQ